MEARACKLLQLSASEIVNLHSIMLYKREHLYNDSSYLFVCFRHRDGQKASTPSSSNKGSNLVV